MHKSIFFSRQSDVPVTIFAVQHFGFLQAHIDQLFKGKQL